MPTGLTPIQCEVAVPTDSEAIDTLVDLLMQGPSDALMETIERHARQADASPDVLSVCALAALFEILMHAATEADIPVLDTDTGRLLSPDEVRAEAVQQVQTEMSVCVERCRGTAQARWMASVLVHMGTRAGNTKGNWGHVFATVARMIDADVRGAEALLLPEE